MPVRYHCSHPHEDSFDECLSRRLSDLLRGAGHDPVHVADAGLLGAPDEEVMAAAVADGRVLISADADFGELLASSNATLPSVVLLRRSERQAHEQAAVLLENLPLISDELDAGALVVVTSDRMRIRSLPLRQRSFHPPADERTSITPFGPAHAPLTSVRIE
ncbi:DUF5615 family PIN-like protein [Haloactinopolyspora alba]|uniref:DUF5615 family PIN-like protein n=1 Tax=Haloactinopolyspora alba TaxID=648780 RepID=UPI0013EE3A89